MSFNNRDEALDDLFDHIFGEEEVTEEDKTWFEEKFGSWFDKLEGKRPPGRRRRGEPSKITGRRGTPSGESQGRRRRRDGDGGYGLSLFYGDKETG